MNWKKTAHKFVKPDWVFAIMLGSSLVVFFTSRSDLQIGGGLTVSPLVKGLLVFGLVALISFLATIGVNMDRKFADDYYFQLMAHGAIVGIITSIMVAGIFVLLENWLPALSIKDIFSSLMAAWALGYFFYRFRGLNS